MPKAQFRFNMQTLLEHRERLVKEAEEGLYKSKIQVQKAKDFISDLDVKIESSWVDSRAGILTSESMMYYQDWRAELNEQKKQARIQLRDLSGIVEGNRKILVQRTMEKEALETLKSEALVVWKKDQMKKEQNFLDEVSQGIFWKSRGED
ncbi:flagellar FliJ family protein [Fibrobacterales bacterium]|nr:flagellar FliJ family protein [Fibrobacterales bacterium]